MIVITPVFAIPSDDLFLPLRILLVVSSLFHFGAMAALLLLFKRVGIRTVMGLSALLVFLISDYWIFYAINGTEMALNLFVVSVFVLALTDVVLRDTKISSKSYLVLGVLASLVVLARLDNVMLVGLVMIYLGWQAYKHRPESWITDLVYYAVPLAVVGAIYVAFNYAVIGSISPVSGQVKMYWYSIGGSVFGTPPDAGIDALKAVFGFSTDTKLTGGPTSIIFNFLPVSARIYLVLGLVAVVVPMGLIKNSPFIRVLLLLLSVSVIHTGFFGVFGYVELNNWYWVTEYVAVIGLLALGFQGVYESFDHTNWRRYSLVGVPIVMLLVMLPSYFRTIDQTFNFDNSESPFYIRSAAFLEANTPVDAVIGTPNAGGVGYFTDRRVVNIDGLSNSPEFLESIKNFEGYNYLKEIGVGYIYRTKGYEGFEPYSHMLQGKLEPIAPDLYEYYPDR
jgi:hypothetical protein